MRSKSCWKRKKSLFIQALELFFIFYGPLAALFNLPEMLNVKRFLQQNPNGFKIPVEKADEISTKMMLIHEHIGIEQMIHFMDLNLTRLPT